MSIPRKWVAARLIGRICVDCGCWPVTETVVMKTLNDTGSFTYTHPCGKCAEWLLPDKLIYLELWRSGYCDIVYDRSYAKLMLSVGMKYDDLERHNQEFAEFTKHKI